MLEEPSVRVRILWEDTPAVLDMLKAYATGEYRAQPIGNYVVVDCAHPDDARRLNAAFPFSRRLPFAPA